MLKAIHFGVILLLTVIPGAVFSQSDCNSDEDTCSQESLVIISNEETRPVDSQNEAAINSDITGQYDPCGDCKGEFIEDKKGYLQR